MEGFSSDDVQGHFDSKDLMFSYTNSFILRSAVLLGIPQLLSEHGPLTVKEIISLLPNATNPQPQVLQRILHFLVHRNVFRETSVKNGEIQYHLTSVSKGLVTNPHLLLMATDPRGIESFLKIHECVLHGGYAYTKANGMHVWETGKHDPEVNKLWNEAMVTWSSVTMHVVLDNYDGFKDAKVLVDIGGGLGYCLQTIIKKYPHIKGINLEVPHTVAICPSIPGVEHVSGDMLESVPSGDTVLIKSMICNFDDDTCEKMLENANKALPSKGKLIIIDLLFIKEGPFELTMDMVMLGFTEGGRERHEDEFRAMLSKAGFSDMKIYSMPSKEQVIEAFKA